MNRASSETLKVLMIEDSEDDALLTIRALRQGGINPVWRQLQTAESLRLALATETWDVLLCDYCLPGFSAPEALAIVKNSQIDLPFIVVSGTIGDQTAIDLMKAGAHDYLMKDSLARLPEVVRREIREAKGRAEHLQAALELEQARVRLQLAIEGSGIGLWDWSIATKTIMVNDQWAEMLGYTTTELAPLTLKAYTMLIHPDDLPKLMRAIERHLHDPKQPYQIEIRMRHRSQHWIWVLTQGRVVEHDAQGKPQRMIGTNLNITDRKESEAALAKRDRYLSVLVESQQQLLANTGQQETYQQVLPLLGEVAGADRVYIFENHYSDQGHLLTSQRAEWCAPGVTPQLTNPALQNVNYQEQCPQWYKLLREGEIITGLTCDFPAEEQAMLAVQDILSVLVIPLFVNNQFFGIIGFDSCQTERQWDALEIGVLKSAAAAIAVAKEREQATQALEQFNQELEDRIAQRTAALQESEARIQAILNFAPNAIYVKNREGKHIAVNRAFLKLFGCQAVDCIGKSNYDFFPAAIAEVLESNDRLVWTTGQFRQQEEEVVLGDQVRTFLSNKFLLYDRDGHPYALCGISTDITNLKAIQAALQCSEERARATLLALPDIVFRVNRHGQCVDFVASQHAHPIVPADQMIGLNICSVAPPAIAARKAQAIETVLLNQEVQVYEHEIEINGHIHYEEVRVAPCGNDEVVFFIRDISDRKRAEAQLQQTNLQLARMTRLKDEFLANMSHELRTPLNAILGMSEGLTEEVFGALSEHQKKAVATIEKSGRHLLDLINDILDLSKIEAGKLELHWEEVAIHNLCQNSLAFVRQMAFKKEICLTAHIPQALHNFSIWADERRIRQVLINLLSNAIKFTPEGGKVDLRVGLEEPSSTFATSSQSSSASCVVVFSVIDTGIGIAQEDLGKLFQPFLQIDSRLSRQYEGTGLGLALVKQIVELHQGSVGVISELGKGSCFTFRLPNARPANECLKELTAVPLQDEVFAPPITKQPRRLLLVEDNEANITTLSNYLMAKGYNVLIACSGQEAITITQAEHPDLILMDVQMPGMDGLQTMQQIRQIPELGQIPIVALTALAMPGDREKCLLAGASEYVSKPVRLKQLVETIERLLTPLPDQSNFPLPTL